MVGEGQLAYREFLAEGLADPQEAFATSLLKALESEGSICVYSPCEQGVLKRLTESLPHLALEVRALMARLVDLLPVVRENVYLPAFQGSYSIKKVLPAIVPGFDYSQLQVQDGLQAGGTFARMVGEQNPVVRHAIRKDLLS
jgi:hypothetical protein